MARREAKKAVAKAKSEAKSFGLGGIPFDVTGKDAILNRSWGIPA